MKKNFHRKKSLNQRKDFFFPHKQPYTSMCDLNLLVCYLSPL